MVSNTIETRVDLDAILVVAIISLKLIFQSDKTYYF